MLLLSYELIKFSFIVDFKLLIPIFPFYTAPPRSIHFKIGKLCFSILWKSGILNFHSLSLLYPQWEMRFVELETFTRNIIHNREGVKFLTHLPKMRNVSWKFNDHFHTKIISILPATGDNFLMTHHRDFHWNETREKDEWNFCKVKLNFQKISNRKRKCICNSTDELLSVKTWKSSWLYLVVYFFAQSFALLSNFLQYFVSSSYSCESESSSWRLQKKFLVPPRRELI